MQVLTTASAIAQFGRPAVRHRLSSGMWQQPERGVVVTHNGPIDAAERLEVILAALPRGSLLGGLTALALDGLTGFGPEATHVIIPNGARRPRLDGIRSHHSIHIDTDVLLNRLPRRTTPARSLIDAASWGPSDRFARALVIATMQQGLTSVRHVRGALVRRPTQLRRGIVVESILDAAGGIQSLPERDFALVVADAGLAQPTRQAPVRGPGGRYYLDAWFEDLGFGVEVHGIPHLAVRQWSDDLDRGNELVISGRRMLVFSSFSIRRERDRVIDQLRRAAGQSAA